MRTKSPTWKESKSCWVNIIRHFVATKQTWPNVSSIITYVSFSQRLLFIPSLFMRFSKTEMHEEWNTAYNPSMGGGGRKISGSGHLQLQKKFEASLGYKTLSASKQTIPKQTKIIIIPKNFTCRENNISHAWLTLF